MYTWEKTRMEDQFKREKKNPSFSSSLLDEIYRSIDEGDTKHEDLKFYRETMTKKQSKNSIPKCNRVSIEEEGISTLRRACLIEKWMEKKVTEKANTQRRQYLSEFEKKSHRDSDYDPDVLFCSSNSSSSDSSSGGLWSSDTDSIYGTRSKVSSDSSIPKPKPVRTSVAASRPEKTEKKTGRTEKSLFHNQSEFHMLDDYNYTSSTEHTPKLSRALKIYSNLKKVKQPISPGGKLANFINSIFTSGHTKKSKNSSSSAKERKPNSGQESTCSSASSFSRSCLSKNSPSTREKLRNGVKRNVTFYPVSVIVDEDCRPCGHKQVYPGQEDGNLMSVSVPTAWKIGKSQTTKGEDENKVHVMEKSRRVEEIAREFLKEYRRPNHRKNDSIMRDCQRNRNVDYDEDEEEDDDAASYSSSDLFELDHLSTIGKERYMQELPVYETTHVNTNHAIANGLIM
ncbi:hypothetical protein HS088_TW04G00303 [Tripterygium wilfordii]|uniref:Protein BIG GRAIN 1-like B n=1 Tax=Tripterygium wilfordii TaxID=458696 RepID=A0A7J7DPR5_TRIWF|nr:protein BIG GRAIN 1-like A [Tripterygium wilfordii]KAF5748350.1 hypothetical protein HS088_TW04G00303 [Tripterygium wilfordii]